jgi:signal transduction histidine kinase/ActR/RegA family two-component response regulator
MSSVQPPRTLLPVRFFLLSIVAFAALPPLIFSVFLLLHYADSQRERAEDGLVESARGVARAIDREFGAAIATLNIVKQSSLLARNEIAPFEQQLRSMTIDGGRGFALIDGNGKLVINTLGPPRAPLSEAELTRMIGAMRDRSPYISDVLVDAGSHEALAYVGMPIFRGGTLLWVLVTFLYSEDFAEVIGEPGVPSDWVVSIVDRHGTHIRRSHRNDEFAGRQMVPALVQRMAARQTGVISTKSLEGIELSSTIAYAPTSGWATAIGLPVEKLQAPLMSSLRSLSVIGVLLAAAALALAYVVARVLDRGFRTLGDSARRLDRGELVDMQPSPIREVHDVTAAMTQVSRNLVERSTALAELNNSLEGQVSARTAELVAEMKRREASEAQLHQLLRIEAIGKLTGGIAHDFNNMLAVVIGSLELMRRHLARGERDIGKFIDSAMQGAENAATLTRRLLAFSRQQALNPVAVDCNKLIGGMSEILRRTIPEHIEIETVSAGGLWRTHIDVAALENAILNLALNARDAMPEGGKLTIETGNVHLDDAYAARHVDVTPGQYVMVAITDTGAGISEDILENVFEPFFTTKEPGHGTGLGLSQVHGFIKQSGGHIKIYSEVGHGTTVKLYLPRLTKDLAPHDMLSSQSDAMPLARENETILVVEDDASVRRGTVSMLEELDYAVLEAEGGPQALQVLEANPDVALLITDVVMPGMNGRQLADEAVRRAPHLKVLFTTGYTRNAIVHHGTLDPGVHLLGKPYTFAALARKVAELLAVPHHPEEQTEDRTAV